MPYDEKKSLMIDCLKTPYNWRLFELVRQDIADMEKLQFEDREPLRAILLRMLAGHSQDNLEPLFDLHSRFPACNNYVFLNAFKYIRDMTNMRMALDDSPLDDTLSHTGKALFYHHFLEFKKNIAKANHVYDRTLFEDTFHLKWHE